MNNTRQEVEHEVRRMTYNDKIKEMNRAEFLELNLNYIDLIKDKAPDDLYILMDRYGIPREILELHIQNLTNTRAIFESLYRKQLAEIESNFNQRQGV
jgi:hypothetical protein